MTEWICVLNILSFSSAAYPDFVCLRRDTFLQKIITQQKRGSPPHSRPSSPRGAAPVLHRYPLLFSIVIFFKKKKTLLSRFIYQIFNYCLLVISNIYDEEFLLKKINSFQLFSQKQCIIDVQLGYKYAFSCNIPFHEIKRYEDDSFN